MYVCRVVLLLWYVMPVLRVCVCVCGVCVVPPPPERYAVIEFENRRMLEDMRKIMTTKNLPDGSEHKKPPSLTKAWRDKEEKRIAIDNMVRRHTDDQSVVIL